ncbi:DUF1365 domain-containing protein [Halobacteriovorax sp. HLS]|uniref:DUF1365 domain-containing protein n=1 Tax=Halobacteriovorax sp. HLS TaxID=2234000 RepID=UPI000FD78E7E|nr:DUF1365 domain-containing protein [Halobacteriovorax sp. HLS]
MRKLFVADIYHKRFLPKVNEFHYGGFYIKFDLDQVDSLRNTIFSLNKFNFFSFYSKDHGSGDDESLRDWALGILSKSGIRSFKGKIVLQTFPRVLGHVFNPVSFWFCYQQDQVVAVICEVNNTFGQRHCYVVKHGKKGVLPKEFHVSPFYDVCGNYEFTFEEDSVVIKLFDNKVEQIVTSIKGRELEWTVGNFLSLWIKYPVYSIMILYRIHYQALKLFLKKIKYFTKPKQKDKEVTYEFES